MFCSIFVPISRVCEVFPVNLIPLRAENSDVCKKIVEEDPTGLGFLITPT